MILLERREIMEEFIQEVIMKIDFELYEPLNIFIHAKENMKRLLIKVAIVKKTFRKFIAKKKLNLVSFFVYLCFDFMSDFNLNFLLCYFAEIV